MPEIPINASVIVRKATINLRRKYGRTKQINVVERDAFIPKNLELEIKESIRYKGSEFVKFDAKDQAWKVKYIWDHKNNELYYQATSLKTHKTKKSLNLFNNNETTRFIKSQLK